MIASGDVLFLMLLAQLSLFSAPPNLLVKTRSSESISARELTATASNVRVPSSFFEYRLRGFASDVIPHLLTDPSGFTSYG